MFYHKKHPVSGWFNLSLQCYENDYEKFPIKVILEKSLIFSKLTFEKIVFNCLDLIGDRTSLETLRDCVIDELDFVDAFVLCAETKLNNLQIKKLFDEHLISKELFDMIQNNEHLVETKKSPREFDKTPEFKLLLNSVDPNSVAIINKYGEWPLS